jgi:sterol desaturase/sphingolipid hydroxylase (fatty acid hydroxylase superfamily)
VRVAEELAVLEDERGVPAARRRPAAAGERHGAQRSQKAASREHRPPTLDHRTDYTLYIWHVLTHKVPLLWRLHRVHHSDLDLSASTALRFHFVEMIVSAPWRAAQVALIGVSPRQLSLWQTLTTMAIVFHHSNIRLPLALERALARVVVTPRMHGIHHSIVERETNSNWGTILSLPDYLHGTIRLNVPQQAIDIGIPAFRRADEMRLGRLMRMPLPSERAAGAAAIAP